MAETHHNKELESQIIETSRTEVAATRGEVAIANERVAKADKKVLIL